MRQQRRIQYVDLFKSIGILLMVMGHVSYGVFFDHMIHGFHMPMFFWISGYLYNRVTNAQISGKQYVLKKAKTLIIPYVSIGLILCLVYSLINGFDWQEFSHFFWDNSEGIKVVGAYWFLTALFLCEIAYFLISRNMKNSIARIVMICIIALFGSLSRSVLPFRLPFSMEAGMVGLGLFGLGRLTRDFMENNAQKHTSNVTSLLIEGGTSVLALVLIRLNGYVNMRTGNYGNILLFWISVTLMLTALLVICKVLTRSFHLPEYLFSIGRDGIIYTCLNQTVIFALKWLVIRYNIPPIVSKPAVLLATMTILWLCSRLIQSTGLLVLIGKFECTHNSEHIQCHGPRKMRIECLGDNNVTRQRKGRPLLICLANETSAW